MTLGWLLRRDLGPGLFRTANVNDIYLIIYHSVFDLFNFSKLCIIFVWLCNNRCCEYDFIFLYDQKSTFQIRCNQWELLYSSIRPWLHVCTVCECVCCERPEPCGSHGSLSCRLNATNDWLLTGFSLTLFALLLYRKFPSLQLVNRQLPSLSRSFHLHLRDSHSQSHITLWMGSSLTTLDHRLNCSDAVKLKKLKKDVTFTLTQMQTPVVGFVYAYIYICLHTNHLRMSTGTHTCTPTCTPPFPWILFSFFFF